MGNISSQHRALSRLGFLKGEKASSQVICKERYHSEVCSKY